MRRSKDMLDWKRIGRVFEDDVPAWAREEIAGARDIWAPDISYYSDRFHLYYSVSTFGGQRSCIGLATNTTLDPSSPDYRWVDHGKVIESFPGQGGVQRNRCQSGARRTETAVAGVGLVLGRNQAGTLESGNGQVTRRSRPDSRLGSPAEETRDRGAPSSSTTTATTTCSSHSTTAAEASRAITESWWAVHATSPARMLITRAGPCSKDTPQACWRATTNSAGRVTTGSSAKTVAIGSCTTCTTRGRRESGRCRSAS